MKAGKKEKYSERRGRRSYSRLLSPFHLQLPLFFPEPSPGTQTPLRTSTRSTSSSRGIRPLTMPASEACIGATAETRGPCGVLSHTQSCLTAAWKDPKQQQTHVLPLLCLPWSVSPGSRHRSRGGRTLTTDKSPRPEGRG